LRVDNELVARSAGPGLRRHIRRYVGYAERTAEPTRQREPPSTGVVLIFGLGPELRLVDQTDPTRPAMRLGSFVAGLDDTCAVIEHDGEMRGVQVDLTPLAARMIFRVPMHALAHQVVALEDLLGREAGRLEDRLLDAGTWSERFDLIESALGKRLAAAEPPPPDIDWAWRRVTTARGSVRIADMAAELGCSRKHLATRFREHVGLPPKLLARLLRFGYAIELLGSSPHLTVADVAAACGYYDQAHLDRDFREFAATTPTAYAADPHEPVTFVQDAAAAAS
jgi:AraC-like DNA-binding protein